MARKKETYRPSSEAPASAEHERSFSLAPKSRDMSRGCLRDALAVLGNVEAALRSNAHALSADEIEELRCAIALLGAAFAASANDSEPEQREARLALDAFAATRVDSVEAALTNPLSPELPDVLAIAAADLDAAAGLFDLVERAGESATVEVSVATLAEEALHLAWATRSQETVTVCVRPSIDDCSVLCDPHVVARVLGIAVATLRDLGPAVVVGTRIEADAGVIEVTLDASVDEPNGCLTTRTMQTQLVRRIAPSEAVLTAAARSAGIEVVVESGRVLVRCPRVA